MVEIIGRVSRWGGTTNLAAINMRTIHTGVPVPRFHG